MDWYNIAVAVGIAVIVSFVVSAWMSAGAVRMAKDSAREMVERAHERITKARNRAEEAHTRITTIRDGMADFKEWRTINDAKTAALEKYLGIEFVDREYTVERKEAHYAKVGKKK